MILPGLGGALAALPYFSLPPIPLGPIDLQPFGILVATGVLFGAWVGRMRGKYLGVDENEVRVLTGYLLVCGFVCAHLFDTLFYQWHQLDDDPLLLIKVWDGISSYGGFIGGVLGWYLFCVVHKVESKIVIGDITIWGFLPGLTFGRMGCSSVHDHLGARLADGKDFFLALNIDEAASRKHHVPVGTYHELGIYELAYLLLIIGLLCLITWGGRTRRVGFVIGFVPLMYAPVRFFFEYLRPASSDPRYFGLTFAQYVSVATFLAAIYAFWIVYRKPAWKPKAVPASESDVEVPEVDRPKKKKGGKPGGAGKGSGGKAGGGKGKAGGAKAGGGKPAGAKKAKDGGGDKPGDEKKEDAPKDDKAKDDGGDE